VAELLIHGVEESLLARLERQASLRGRTAEDEAKEILAAALSDDRTQAWASVNALRERLAATGRDFDDSTALIREDRDR
jgi:plasmid stability protein